MSRAHIHEDVEPYFCLSEECSDIVPFFVHFKDWLNHMNERHTMGWYRNIHMMTWFCDLRHEERQLFYNSMELDHHLKESHSELTKSQMIARSKRGKCSLAREQFTCPLCESIPRRLLALNPHQRPDDVSTLIGRHVAFHIKALSLLAFRLLPAENKDESDRPSVSSGGGENFSDARPSSQTDGAETGGHQSSSTFTDIFIKADDSEWSETRTDEAISVVGTDPIPESFDSETWDFVPGFAHLSSQQTVIPLGTPLLQSSRDPRRYLRHHDIDFEPHKDTIEELFIGQGKLLAEVMNDMKMNYGFDAS
jgi:hypothetical protein